MSDCENDEHSDTDETINITEIKSNVKFLPSTVDGLAHRFNQLFKKFTRQGKHEHRNKLIFLLDELLRQDGINQDKYAQFNNMLADSLDDEEEIESIKDEAAESTMMEEETHEGKLRKINLDLLPTI